jgi:type IV pilus assembly protein PilC
MSRYCYEAVDSGGLKMHGTLEVMDQNEALRRIKEMGLFPTRIDKAIRRRRPGKQLGTGALAIQERSRRVVPVFSGRVRPRALAVFTRQLATLVEAGMPVLRGLRILQEQESNPLLKRAIGEVARSIEAGSSLSEALAAFPKVFNPLYLNMVKAGELGGALELTMRRLAEFMEKAQRIRGKVKAALAYPAAVLVVAACILGILMVYVIPRFQHVFEGLLAGAAMPRFTLLIMNVSQVFKEHFLGAVVAMFLSVSAFLLILHTRPGRWWFDRFRLSVPLLGPVFRKTAVSRFARTLGTLLNSGVPILQSLTIVKETTGNVVVRDVVSAIHDSVKEGETIAAPLKASGIFPALVAGMVDVGEQTGALPDMLMKVADTYDEEVDNAVGAMTSLLEPILILFLAVIVGSIVFAMFLPLLAIMEVGFGGRADGNGP